MSQPEKIKLEAKGGAYFIRQTFKHGKSISVVLLRDELEELQRKISLAIGRGAS